ncbi:MAG: cytochrome P450 [Chloroflexi bacterium]|nr:cytochrome P450 [Chloroflexota bacterium]
MSSLVRTEDASSDSPLADWDPEDPAMLEDISGTLAELRARCPVPYTQRTGGYYAFTRYADIRAATRDPDTYSSAGEQLMDGLRRIPIELDPPEHTAYRRIMQPYFSAARMQALEPRVRQFAAELLQPLIERGRGDIANAFTFPFPTRVLCATLNIPDEDWAKLKLWAGESRLARTAGSDNRGGAAGGNEEFVAYAREMIASRRIAPLDPTEDLTSGLLAARVNGEPLTDERILGIVRLLLSAGHNSTTISLGILIGYLAMQPDVQRRLRTEPALIPQAIEEILRYETPVVANANPRIVTRDVTVNGRALKRGDRVVLLWGSGNHDDDAFPDADRCIIDRSPNRNFVFGHGVHMCIGAPVARLELRIALEELLRRTHSFEVDDPLVRGPWWRQRGPTQLPLRFEGAHVS